MAELEIAESVRLTVVPEVLIILFATVPAKGESVKVMLPSTASNIFSEEVAVVNETVFRSISVALESKNPLPVFGATKSQFAMSRVLPSVTKNFSVIVDPVKSVC